MGSRASPRLVAWSELMAGFEALKRSPRLAASFILPRLQLFAGILIDDALPQRLDHVLHDKRVLPAVRQLGAVGSGDGVRRWTELAEESQHRIGACAFSPGADSVFPPIHEQFDPALVLRKAERDLDLLAAGDPAVNAPGMIENAMDQGVIDLVHRPGEFAAHQIVRDVSGQPQVGKTFQ